MYGWNFGKEVLKPQASTHYIDDRCFGTEVKLKQIKIYMYGCSSVKKLKFKLIALHTYDRKIDAEAQTESKDTFGTTVK